MIKKFIARVIGKGKAAQKEAPAKEAPAKEAPAKTSAPKAGKEKPSSAPSVGTSRKGAKKSAEKKTAEGSKRTSSGSRSGSRKKSGGARATTSGERPARGEGSRPRSSGARGSGGGHDSRRGGGEDSARRGRGRNSSGAPARPPQPMPELPPLPDWVPPDDVSSFAAYDLPSQVMEGIKAAGFEKCTEVQSKVLPLALRGRDIAAQSQTGTGKTAAFLITTFTRLMWRGKVDHPGPRALILAPTRELTVQIERDAQLLGKGTGLKVGVAFGGVDYDRQRQALLDGVDVLVGTPGRLIDYLKQGVWHPEGIEMLVIDEADRMLDMGFIRDLRFILRRLPPFERRLSMLFSATLSWRAMELTYEYMNLPDQISASPAQVTAERAEEVLYHVERGEKAALLLGLMTKGEWERTMIFTNMKIEAEKVGRLLQHHGIRGQAITGNLEQKKRLQLMEDFKSGDLPALVATDVASRGLHIEGVTHVVNWDLPQDPEDYVHRIGRTARAGAEGKAISLADEECVYYLESIEKLIGYKIPVAWHAEEDLAKVKPGWKKTLAARRPSSGRPQTRGGGPSRGGSGGGRGSRHGGRR
jgi:ATP-dependent RNA helicase RhlB